MWNKITKGSATVLKTGGGKNRKNRGGSSF